MAEKRDTMNIVMVTETYTSDLRGRQSVRTTFKLPPRCIDALSLLAGQLGIKQKSIFDHLVDDTKALQELARDIEERQTKASDRVPKTYVISRRSLENLEQVSKRFQTPRDALVEFSIERIMPLLEEEKRKHAQRKTLVAHIDRLVEQSTKLLEEADDRLERDDPVFERIYQMARTVKDCSEDVKGIVEKGTRLEDY